MQTKSPVKLPKTLIEEFGHESGQPDTSIVVTFRAEEHPVEFSRLRAFAE